MFKTAKAFLLRDVAKKQRIEYPRIRYISSFLSSRLFRTFHYYNSLEYSPNSGERKSNAKKMGVIL